MPFTKGFMFIRLGIMILALFLVSCAGSGEKSELLSLLGVDEKIVDNSDQGSRRYMMA